MDFTEFQATIKVQIGILVDVEQLKFQRAARFFEFELKLICLSSKLKEVYSSSNTITI